MSLPTSLRFLAVPLAAALCLSLAACGGGADDASSVEPLSGAAADDGTASIAAVASTNTLHVGISIPGYPHKVDVYRPAGATRAIVFLHGLGGRSWQMAYDMGLNLKMAPVTSKYVNWDWLTRNKVIAVFPQGMPQPSNNLPAWSNYIQDSGQDDVGFLKSLSAYVKAQYGATEVSLSGHSNGGAMTARVWCEATTSFKAFVTLAGPMPSSTYPIPAPTCTPLAPAPYYAIIGSADTKLDNFALGSQQPSPQQMAAGLTDSILVSEWSRHFDRSQRVCGEQPAMTNQTVTPTGPTWNACGGKLRYTVVNGADHPIASIEQYAGVKMVDVVNDFAK